MNESVSDRGDCRTALASPSVLITLHSKGSHLEKNLLLFGIFSKRGGGGGSCLNPNVLRNFFVLFMFGHFSERRGLPNTKLFEKLICLCLVTLFQNF